MENTKENQEFTSKDVVGVFASLAFMLLVAMNALGSVFEGYRGDGARHEMVKLSRQLMTHGEHFQPKSDSKPGPEVRSPASLEPQNVIESIGLEGKIAKDPWGEPYQYKLFQKASKVYAVAIWSKGPNGELELEDKDFLTGASGRVFQVLGAGDDLAHIEIIH